MADSAYLLPISDTMSVAWNKVKGAKATIWGAFALIFVIMFCLGFMDGLIKAFVPAIEPVTNIIVQVIGFLLNMGLMFIGIQRAKDAPITYTQIFRAFEGRIAIRVIALYVLEVILCILPICVIIGGAILTNFSQHSIAYLISGILIIAIGVASLIYIAIRIFFAMAFILDQVSNPWESIKQTLIITRSNFWRLIWIFILQTFIILVSAIPLGIGLIWTLPFAIILYGVMYQKLSKPASLDQATPQVSR